MPIAPPKHHPNTPKAKTHKSLAEKDHRQDRRLYATNHRVWRAIRAEQLAHEPLCRECTKANRVTPATDVDHIDGDSHNNRPSNIQSLCRSHHSAKTVRENGGFGRTPVNKK